MDSGFMANPNNTIVPPPMMAMQVTVDTPLCKKLRFQDLKYPVSNIFTRVLLQAGPPLWQGHDFLYQPQRGQVPGRLHAVGYRPERHW